MSDNLSMDAAAQDPISFTLTSDKTGVSKTYVDELISKEKTEREATVTNIRETYTELINTETSERKVADSTFDSKITANTDAIAKETIDRQSADEILQTTVTNNKKACDNRFTTLSNGLTAERTYCNDTIAAEASYRKADKAELESLINTKAAGALKYKGSVKTVSDLPTSATIGDMYNVEADEQNYAWNGEKWDSLGAIIDVAGIEKRIADNATLCGTKEDKSNKVTDVSSSSTDSQYPTAKLFYTTKTDLDERITTNTSNIATNTKDISTLSSTKEDKANMTTTISEASLDSQYPSALATKTYVDSMLGNQTITITIE